MNKKIMNRENVASGVAITVLLVLAGCNSQPAEVARIPQSNEPTKEARVEFTEDESRLLGELGIAIFRNKIILDARPPITHEQLIDLEKQVDGKVPPDLLALWQTSFGGQLDYDYEVQFGEHRYTASFRELFYPNSNHYHDLYGWIDHELEIGQEFAEENGDPIPERTPFLPFGGFEYLERFYVSLMPNDYGQVLVYAQGIPWKGRLNEDSTAVVARSVSELFDQLDLKENPFSDQSSKYASGKDMLAKIDEIELRYPTLAEKLKIVVRQSIFDWESILERTDSSSSLSAEQLKALRLALSYAADHDDVDLINRLHAKKLSFDQTISGTSGVINDAMTMKSFSVVERLLELNVEVGKSPIIHATDCSNELLLKLIEHNLIFDEEAIYSAAETGAIDGAIALCNKGQFIDSIDTEDVVETAKKRAASHEQSAIKLGTGQLGSYLTAEQYREQASSLRFFADCLSNDSK